MKNIFWKAPAEEEKTPAKSTKETAKTTTKNPGSISDITAAGNFNFENSAGNTTQPPVGIRNEEIAAYFKKVMEENNFPGPDYCEFINALEGMKNLPMDEATKVKTIFLSFKTMGMTPQKLIETAEKYKALYDQKMKAFDKEVEASYNNEIVSRQKQVETLAGINVSIDAEMKKLNDQKIANDEAVKKLNDEAASMSTNIKTRHSNFKETYVSIVAEIDNNIATINKHLL